MDLKDEFKYLVSGYYGIMSMDNYDLKVYILKDIENYIKDFIEVNPIDGFDYKAEAEKYKDELPLMTKLQDSLLVLNKIDAPIELVLLVKAKIKKLKENELKST